jgi:hypothetical protein
MLRKQLQKKTGYFRLKSIGARCQVAIIDSLFRNEVEVTDDLVVYRRYLLMANRLS